MNLPATLKTPVGKLIAALLGIIVLGALILGVSRWLTGRSVAKLTREQTELKQQLQQKVDDYNQLIGAAHVLERLAREEKQKSDAMRAEYERRIGNVKALDDKLATAETNYEKAKAELGDCGETNAECLKRLCVELQKAGFKVRCE